MASPQTVRSETAAPRAAGAACARPRSWSTASPTARSICKSSPHAAALSRQADRSPRALGRQSRPIACSWRNATAEGGAAGARITYAQTLDKVRRIGAALLTRNLSAERPIVILSGNDLEHALLGLAANYVGIPYAPVSPAYSLISSDFGKLRHIVNLLTPGLVFACDGAQYARAIEAVVPPDVEVVVTRNLHRPATPFAELDAAPDAARCGACEGRPRHDREIPVHLRLDRHAEGRDQHAAHVVREPGDDRDRAAVLRRRAAGDRRLGAVASHRRRQSRRRAGAPQWRHDVHRRRQAAARRDRGDGAQPARDRADLVLHGAEGLRGAAAVLPRRRGAAREFLLPPEGAVVRRRRPRAARVRRVEGHGVPHLRRGHSLPHRPRLDRDRALCVRPHVGHGERRQYRPAAARPRR